MTSASSSPVAPLAWSSAAAAVSAASGLVSREGSENRVSGASGFGVVRAVRARLALDDDPARELDVAIDALQRQVEDDVPEGVVGALGIHVRARDAQLVRDQPLVVVEVGRNDHQALAKRCDRPG